MFETSETTFEVFSLRSYVSIRVCGRFFEMWGIPFSKCGKSGRAPALRGRPPHKVWRDIMGMRNSVFHAVIRTKHANACIAKLLRALPLLGMRGCIKIQVHPLAIFLQTKP